MRTRNRLPAVLLTLVMIISMLPVSTFAENDPPTPTGQVEADPGSLSFGSVQQDYASISPKPVTIRNNTAANVTIISLDGLSSFEVTVMDANAQPLALPHELSPGESMNIAVNPKNGLAEGDYNEKLTIVYNDGEEKTLNVALSFGVGDVAPQPSSYTVTVKADPDEGGTVSVPNGGKVNAGQEITVTATANNSYVFDGWYEGTVQKSMDASYKFTPVGDITLTAKFIETYPVWVGATQATEENKDDILNDGGKAKYDPASKTLTLNDPAISDLSPDLAVISAEEDLTITGSATLNVSGAEYGIRAGGKLSINGDISATGDNGIFVPYDDISIEGGTVTATATFTATPQSSGGGGYALYTESMLIISGGTVTASATNLGRNFGVFAQEGLLMTAGSLDARGYYAGVHAPTGGIEIRNGVGRVYAQGNYRAIYSEVDAISIGDQLSIIQPTDGQLSPDKKTIISAGSGAPAQMVEIVRSCTVTLQADPPAGGTVTGGGVVYYGREITVTATPEAGYVFDGWYEGTTEKSTDASYKFTPVGDITLTAKFTPLNPVSYSVTGGADSIWTRGSGATLTVTVKRSPDDASCYSHFTGVEIDGTALVRDTDYTAAAGSTVVTLRAAALQKLSVGSHNVTVRFDDGKVSTGLTVKAAASSGNGASASKGTKTGDESDLALWSILMLLSAAAMIVLLLCARKRKIEK